MQESLGTHDKRVAAVVAALLLPAFAAANYDALRAAVRACASGEYILVPPFPSDDSPGRTLVRVESATVCPADLEPTTTQLAMSYGSLLSVIIFTGVALVLLCWFLWGAVRPGLRSPGTPGRLRTLGWFVLVAGPVATALKYWFTYELAESLVRDTAYVRANPDTVVDFNGRYAAWLRALTADFPWWCVFAGAAALVVARLLRDEVRIADEILGG